VPEPTAHVGVLSVELYFPAPNSLKEKRMILKSVLDRIRGKFNVSAAEIGELDKWQKSICGVSMIGNEKEFVDSGLQKIVSLLEHENGIQVIDYQIVFV